MQNLVQDGSVLTLTPSAAVSSGGGVKFGDALFGVAVTDVASGTPGAFRVRGVVTLPSTGTIAQGAIVSWNGSAAAAAATGAIGIGVAVSAAASNSVNVLLGAVRAAAS